MKKIAFVLISLVAIVALVAVFESLGSPSDSIGATSSTTYDASADLACTHFRDVARDYSQGLLTLPELRVKLQEVWNDAQVSTSPGVSSGSRAMLADLTQGRIGHLSKSITHFDHACTTAGF